MAATGKQLDIYPQTIKGLCIVCVVLIHLPWGHADEWTGWLWISVRQIINFAVATFFFLSAYYTKPAKVLYSSGLINYYKKRFTRILLPYLFWASVYIIVIPIITAGHIEDNWCYYYLTGKGPTYFLLALAQFTILNPILQKYKDNRAWNLFFLLVTPMYLTFYYWYNFKAGREFKPEQFFCFPWFACYYLGLKMQDRSFRKVIGKLSPISAIVLCITLLLLSNIEAFFVYSFTGIYSFAISQITIGSVIYSLGMIMLFRTLWKDESNQVPNWLTSLGDYSMGIFLMHPTFNWLFKFLILHLPGGLTVYSSTLGFTIIHLIILVFSVSASYLVSRFLSDKFPRLIIPLGLK